MAYIRQSKGFLTAEGKIVDYAEWHVVAAAFFTVTLAFILHPIFLALNIWIVKRVVEDKRREEGYNILETIKYSELPYWLGVTTVSVMFFQFLGLELSGSGMALVFEVVKTWIGI